MASCIELLKKSFPKIEGELQEYVSSKFQFTSFVTIISLNETTSVAIHTISCYYFPRQAFWRTEVTNLNRVTRFMTQSEVFCTKLPLTSLKMMSSKFWLYFNGSFSHA